MLFRYFEQHVKQEEKDKVPVVELLRVAQQQGQEEEEEEVLLEEVVVELLHLVVAHLVVAHLVVAHLEPKQEEKLVYVADLDEEEKEEMEELPIFEDPRGLKPPGT